MKREKILFLVIAGGIILILWVALFVGKDKIRDIQSLSSFLQCQKSKIDCVQRVFETTARQHGANHAIRIFSKYIDIQNINSVTCHVYGHNIGHVMYLLNDTSIQENTFDFSDLPEEFSLCQFGILHGMIEHLDSNNVSVNNVCKKIKNTIKSEHAKGFIEEQCYDGFGHSFIFLQTQLVHRKQWGDIEAFVSMPLQKCTLLENVTETAKNMCVDGVIFSMIYLIKNNTYNFSLVTHNPLQICEIIDVKWRSDCLLKTLTLIFDVSDFDLSAIESALTMELPEKYKKKLVQSLVAHHIGRQEQKNIYTNNHARYKSLLAQCQSLEKSFYASCFSGILKRLYDTTNTDGHRPAMILCEDPIILQHALRVFCYEQIAKWIYYFFPQKKAFSLCEDFPSDMKKMCLTQTRITSFLQF